MQSFPLKPTLVAFVVGLAVGAGVVMAIHQTRERERVEARVLNWSPLRELQDTSSISLARRLDVARELAASPVHNEHIINLILLEQEALILPDDLRWRRELREELGDSRDEFDTFVVTTIVDALGTDTTLATQMALAHLLDDGRKGRYSDKHGFLTVAIRELASHELGEHAHRALIRITGEDVGRDSDAWQSFLMK